MTWHFFLLCHLFTRCINETFFVAVWEVENYYRFRLDEQARSERESLQKVFGGFVDEMKPIFQELAAKMEQNQEAMLRSAAAMGR